MPALSASKADAVRSHAVLLALAMVTGGAQAADGGVPAEPLRPWIDPVVSAGFERIVARCRFIYTQPLRPLQRVVLREGDDAPATYALAGLSHDLVMTRACSHPFRGSRCPAWGLGARRSRAAR